MCIYLILAVLNPSDLVEALNKIFQFTPKKEEYSGDTTHTQIREIKTRSFSQL